MGVVETVLLRLDDAGKEDAELEQFHRIIIPVLEKKMLSAARDDRFLTVSCIRLLCGDQLRGLIMAALSDDDLEVRVNAARIAWQCYGLAKEAIPIIIAGFRDSSVEAFAAACIQSLGLQARTKGVMSIWKHELARESELVREKVLDSLAAK